jgi:hypothetical protein
MRVIVDADHVTYRAAASCSPTKAKPYQEGLEEALWRCESMVAQIYHDLNVQEAEFFISGQGNWRYAIYPEYKANRKDIPKPMWLEDVREHLLVKYKAEIVNDKEVDDQCGIRLTQEGMNGICASLDKDLRTVPGNHYSWETRTAAYVKPAQRIFVSPFDALRNFYGQVITGDQSDNIPAFDGKFRATQPKFVLKLLEPLKEMTEELDMYNHVCKVYEDHYGNPLAWDHIKKIIHRNASVLWIQRQEGDAWQSP